MECQGYRQFPDYYGNGVRILGHGGRTVSGFQDSFGPAMTRALLHCRPSYDLPLSALEFHEEEIEEETTKPWIILDFLNLGVEAPFPLVKKKDPIVQ